jgi:hypothetical protein
VVDSDHVTPLSVEPDESDWIGFMEGKSSCETRL